MAFLHDIGKANRGFRARWTPGVQGAGHIAPIAWLYYEADKLRERLWQALGFDTIELWLTDGDGPGARPLLDAVFAHHGTPWPSSRPPMSETLWRPTADGDPIADLAIFGRMLPLWFPRAFEAGPPLPSNPAFHHAFAGLVMLADWIGSDAAPDCFPFANGVSSDRMAFARHRVPRILEAIGLHIARLRRRAVEDTRDFATTFGFRPRRVQSLAAEPGAHCVVIEAETGSGKTEAALWRFRALFRAGAVDGMYFALPTRVAATQVHDRIVRFADAAFGAEDRPAVVLAVPGQQKADHVRGRALPDFGFAWDDAARHGEAGVARERWAAEHPKRFLAAYIAVGTIDQALLGAIEQRHAHMRSTSLLRSLLVVDEVHASDRYMNRLLRGLLRTHLTAGGHALLLSATLGAAMRADLLNTPVPPRAQAEATPFPALSWAEGQVEQRLDVAPAQAALLANVLPCYSLPGMNRQRVDAVMIESWRRGGVGGGTVNLIDRGRNEARQMEPDVPMAMPF